ncbi:hypothetical protein GWI33_019881 [Rhynchophorus ferrugineus]|uniref:Uncharacterized protein n=1 Tax=Rhynchophorus ferrugineus TaxID=354439 RepID=A0A834HSN7_RHYFE|nr:hypothetical protein GWI33_019881 [Rhynchophorus ferrugineus]
MNILKINQLITIYVIFLIHLCYCVEEYEREYFLQPRHFNPHPYEHELDRIQDPGPVVFPRSDEDDEVGINRYNIITINTIKRKQPTGDTPYTKVSEKIKNFVFGGRFSTKGQDHQQDNEIYDALANHGAKVLSHPAQDLKKYQGLLPKKDYAFAYKVLDKKTGDDFSHQQVQSAKATNGEYRVKLPDGRLQIVSYKADKDGYKADVRYEEDPDSTQQKLSPSPAPNSAQYDVYQQPQNKFSPQYIDYDYGTDGKEQQLLSPLKDPAAFVLEQPGPTRIPVNYVDVPTTPAPSAYLVGGPVNHGLRSYPKHQPNVEIYSSNTGDNNHLSHVSSTLAPVAYQNNFVRYTSTPLPPVTHSYSSKINKDGLYTINLNNYNKKIVSTTPYPVGDDYHKALAQEDELPEGIYIVGKSGKK